MRLATSSLLLPLTRPATAPHQPCYCPSPTLLLPLTCPATAPHPPCPSPTLLLPLTTSPTLHLCIPHPSPAPPLNCSAAVSCTLHLPPPSHLQRCSVMRKPRDEPAERKVGRQAMHLGGGAHGGSSSFSRQPQAHCKASGTLTAQVRAHWSCQYREAHSTGACSLFLPVQREAHSTGVCSPAWPAPVQGQPLPTAAIVGPAALSRGPRPAGWRHARAQ